MKNSRTVRCIGRVLSFAMLALPLGATWAMADVESRSGDYRPPAAEEHASLDMLKKMEFLQQEVQELRGKVEEQAYQLNQLQERQKKLYVDLDQRLKQTGKSGTSGISIDGQELVIGAEPTASTTTAAPAPVPVAATDTAAAQSAGSEQELYQKAYRAIQSKDYDTAIIGFETLIKDFPNGKYAPNAYYWVGEIYVTKGKPELAIHSFNQIYALFPKHPKSADALLKLGLIEHSKGQYKAAAKHFTLVKTQFPGTTSAQLAESRLAKMQTEGQI